MSEHEINVPEEDVEVAWNMIRKTMRRHIKCHDDLPRLLFTSPAGIAAIKYGVLGDDLADMRVIMVAHWKADTNMTVA